MLVASESCREELKGKKVLTTTTTQRVGEREDRGQDKRKGDSLIRDPSCPVINNECASCGKLKSKKGCKISHPSLLPPSYNY